jgi:putative transposase
LRDIGCELREIESASGTGRGFDVDHTYVFLPVVRLAEIQKSKGLVAMIRAHKIRIYPNNKQATMPMKHCGVSRLAYNTCLAKQNADYTDGIKHNYYSIKKWWNSIKGERFPFVYEVSKWAAEAAIAGLGGAFKKLYGKQNAHPKFHKKGVHDSFRIDGNVIKTGGKLLKLPKRLNIRMAESLRYDASKIYNVTVSRTAGMWFASIQCEVPDSENQASGEVGIDLGIKDLATLSDGTKYENPHVEKKYRKKIAYAQRRLHRRKKGSKGRRKAQNLLAKLYYKATCARKDYTHKFTSEVAGKYATVCLEDLNVRGMQGNHHLARAISDAALAEIRRQFEYKATEVRYVGRFEPSSKTCGVCGYYKQDMTLAIREWVCPNCGATHDRDVNAAANILRWASPEVKPADRHTNAKAAGMKRESNGSPAIA